MPAPAPGKIDDIESATIRFAGDVADGVQAIAAQFTAASTAQGNAVATLTDLPAEIRAPAGALAGVTSVQVHFSKNAVHTPGDLLSALVAMNPAALKTHLADVEPGGTLIVNSDAFSASDLEQAGYTSNPLADGSLSGYRLLAVPMTQLNREALARVNLSPREVERCRNFFALGLACWLYQRPLEPTHRWIRDTYAKNPGMIEAITRTLNAGHHYHDRLAPPPTSYRVSKATIPSGRYRNVNGIDALALGLLTASRQAQTPLVFSSFPVAPAADLLHRLAEWKQPGARIIQAADDLAAINFALGTAFGGGLGVTATTGQGLALQSESLSLAVMSELPLVVIDVQRAGPSTGMPSKVEQADLLQALHGRNGECPLIVLAIASPADGYAMALEAIQLAIRAMSPVIVLADAYLALAEEPWRVPALAELPAIEMRHPPANAAGFQPYQRDENLSRPWAKPGTPGLEHRIGGLEKEDRTGNVSYDPIDHEKMVQLRADKIARVANAIPPLEVEGPAQGDLLVLGWGSTYGAIRTAAERCRRAGVAVANAHLRHLHPLPANVASVLGSYRRILVPELNAGQLVQVLRAMFAVDIVGLNKLQGRPFFVSEIENKIRELVT